jgi:beta-lactamase regulating signal transducer with metallopeptidase domain
MTPAFHLLDCVSVLSADFFVASVWQALLLALLSALIMRLVPRLSSAVKSTIWTAVLLLALLVPVLSLVLPHHVGSHISASTGIWHPSDRWSLLLLGLWAALSLVRFAQLIINAVRLQKLAKRATVITPVNSVAALLRRGPRPVTLSLCSEFDRPIIAGFFHPQILISPELYAKLSITELEQVVLHEVEHLRRYDDWTNLLQKLSLALLPLHPVLLWLDRQMCLERELACDDSVLREKQARKSYATCLTRLAEDSLLRRGFSLALGALGSSKRTSELSLRVHRILSRPEPEMTPARAWIATCSLLAVLVGGAIGLIRSPQLLSFTTAPQFAPSPPSFNSALTVSAEERTDAPHPAFVQATFHGNKPSQIVPAVARRSLPSHVQARTRNVMQRRYPQKRFYTALTTSRRSTSPTALTFIVSHTPDQQFLYAAVPVSDGWLILQL